MKTHYLVLTLCLQVCAISNFSTNSLESSHALTVLLSNFPSFGYLIPIESFFLILLAGTAIFMGTHIRQLITFGEFRYSMVCDKAELDILSNESIGLEHAVGNENDYLPADTTAVSYTHLRAHET